MTNLASASKAGKRNANRFEPVRCQACGRSVKRKSRQQRYCSDRCRKYASRENAASQINARTALKNRAGYQGTRPVREPILLSNKNNSLQRAKSGSSIPLNVLGSYRWPDAPKLDPETLERIRHLEIGALVEAVT
jgi:hypothetical protein